MLVSFLSSFTPTLTVYVFYLCYIQTRKPHWCARKITLLNHHFYRLQIRLSASSTDTAREPSLYLSVMMIEQLDWFYIAWSSILCAGIRTFKNQSNLTLSLFHCLFWKVYTRTYTRLSPLIHNCLIIVWHHYNYLGGTHSTVILHYNKHCVNVLHFNQKRKTRNSHWDLI